MLMTEEQKAAELESKYNADKRFRRYGKGINLPLKCEKCGACCKSMVLAITKEDIAKEPRLKEFITPISELDSKKYDFSNRTEKYFLLIGWRYEGEDRGYKVCPFLKNNRCSIYKTRPEICRSYPINLFECKKAALVEAGMTGSDLDAVVKNVPLPTALFLIWTMLEWDPEKVRTIRTVLKEINPNRDQKVFFKDRIWDIFYDREDSVKAHKENLKRYTSLYGEDFKLSAFE